jgi:hypothetical protein
VTPALLDRPASLFAERSGAGADPARANRLGGGRVTLEELLTAAIDTARVDGSAECPVCHSGMTYTRAGAQCGGCGARLH